MDPSSPLRYFASRPYAFRDIRSIKMLRKFISTHPNCYSQFCNRVCSTVPAQFQQFQNVPIQAQQNRMREEEVETDSGMEEEDEGFIEDEESEGGSSETRSVRSMPVQGEGNEIILTRMGGNNRMPMAVNPVKINEPYKKPNWFSRQINRLKKNDAWRTYETQKRYTRYNRVEKLCQSKNMAGTEIKILCSECMPYLKDDREMIPACEVRLSYKSTNTYEDYGKWKAQLNHQGIEHQGKEEDMSDTSSQSSGSSEGSQQSRTSHSSHNSGLTKEIVGQVPMGGPPSIQQWAQKVSNS
ncbi:MAG: hypothetical protein ACK5PQ_01050 [Alphaproteobacteria bacterium]